MHTRRSILIKRVLATILQVYIVVFLLVIFIVYKGAEDAESKNSYSLKSI